MFGRNLETEKSFEAEVADQEDKVVVTPKRRNAQEDIA